MVRVSARVGPRDTVVLSVRDLIVSTALRARCVDGVSLDIAPGEILGIAGVEGNGQTELVEAIAGLRAAAGGTITLRGADASEHDLLRLDVRQRGDAGLSYIPEDRHRRGLILEYTVGDNLVLGRQHHFSKGARLDRERIARNAQEQIRAFDIRPADAALPARALSGGNQQKIVIAREMGREFQVLLASQPTRGVDVGAIEFIHRQLRDARAAGKAILLVSADLAEILALSDRVAVMYGGRIVAVMNAEFVGPWDVAPRAHPGDGLIVLRVQHLRLVEARLRRLSLHLRGVPPSFEETQALRASGDVYPAFAVGQDSNTIDDPLNFYLSIGMRSNRSTPSTR